MKRQLVLSLDYEIFGNGAGDVRRHVIEPAGRMANICERHGMPLSVFFEVEEFLAFERERKNLIPAWGYDPADEIRAQVIHLMRRGHDFQLHIHPEWVDASFDDGRWLLCPRHATVDSLFDGRQETSEIIRSRKAVIDGMYEAASDVRRVRAYRAGAFCAQPGTKLLQALAENGIIIDSSLVKGMVRRDPLAHLDYSAAPPLRRHWRVSSDVACEDVAGHVTELPIHSRMGRRIQQLTPTRLLAKFSSHVPMDKQRDMVNQLGIGRSPAGVLRFLRQRFPIKLDFHNMSSGQMLRWIRNASPPPAGDLDVIVLIGHTKEHRDDTSFERFLAAVAADPMLEVVSLSQVAGLLQAGSCVQTEPACVA